MQKELSNFMNLGPNGPVWSNVGPYGLTWNPKGPTGLMGPMGWLAGRLCGLLQECRSEMQIYIHICFCIHA